MTGPQEGIENFILKYVGQFFTNLLEDHEDVIREIDVSKSVYVDSGVFTS